jgi:hypothetical protein
MLAKLFKIGKIALAVVLCLAGYAASVQAISQGEPGEALLVPYVLYDSTNQINTMIGITVPSTLGTDPTQIERDNTAYPWPGFTTAYDEEDSDCDLTGAPDSTLATGTISWWFFNDIGTIQHEGVINTGCDDFVPIDWGAVVNASIIPALDGMLGFMLIANNAATTGTDDPEFTMYADVAVVRGNWQSAAFIPVVPMPDSPTNDGPLQGVNEIVYTGGQPSSYSPLTGGMGLDNDDGTADDTVRFDMRYFLGVSGLNGTTEMVVWLDQNCRGGADGCDRSSVPVEVFDTDRSSVAQTMDLGKMLNVIDPSTLARPSNADEGFVRVRMPEVSDSTVAGDEGPDHAGVAFSLIRFSTPGNAQQVQTALAHERGVK